MDGVIGVGLTLGASIVSGVLKFAGVETRVERLEKSDAATGAKLDKALESLARIEGRFLEADKHGS